MKKIGLWLISLSLVTGLGVSLVSALDPPTTLVAAEPVGAAGRDDPWEDGVVDRVARGLEVYRTFYCGTCHTLKAAGTLGIFAPPHDAVGVIAGARIQDPHYRGRATSAEAYLIESIVDPKAYVVPGYGLTYHHMPAYTALSETDLDALVTMLLAQTGVRQ